LLPCIAVTAVCWRCRCYPLPQVQASRSGCCTRCRTTPTSTPATSGPASSPPAQVAGGRGGGDGTVGRRRCCNSGTGRWLRCRWRRGCGGPRLRRRGHRRLRGAGPGGGAAEAASVAPGEHQVLGAGTAMVGCMQVGRRRTAWPGRKGCGVKPGSDRSCRWRCSGAGASAGHLSHQCVAGESTKDVMRFAKGTTTTNAPPRSGT
jgi:hypothetical protein